MCVISKNLLALGGQSLHPLTCHSKALDARTQRMQNIKKYNEYSMNTRPFGGICVGRSGRQVFHYSNSSLWLLMLILWSPDVKS